MNNKTVIFEVTKEETGVFGYWADAAGVVYRDNIKAVAVSCEMEFNARLEALFTAGEKAVFVQGQGRAYIFDQSGAVETLTRQEVKFYQADTLKRPEFIARLLRKYGGFTVDTNKAGTLGGPWTVTIWLK